MASIPSRTLLGVERVVIACDADSNVSDADRRAICAQLVKKAQSVTRLQVTAATQAEIEPANFALPGDRLVLKVRISAHRTGADRGTLSLAVSPGRTITEINKAAPMKSEAQFARVQNRIVVQGPVDAFNKILRSAPASLHWPVVTDD